jgi:hypothetical protein
VNEFFVVIFQVLHVTQDLLFKQLILELLVLIVFDHFDEGLNGDAKLALSKILTLLLAHVIAGQGRCLIFHRIKKREKKIILNLN